VLREPTEPKKVRIVSVPTAVEGNLLATLVADFQKSTGLEITIESTEGPFQVARDGKADLVVSHYGHRVAAHHLLEPDGPRRPAERSREGARSR
jgi:DNA-binding transcriptional LysR family regulator